MKKVITLVFILMMMMTFITTAQAEVRAGSFSFTPFIGGYGFEGNENLKKTYTVGLRAGYNFTENWGVEGFFNYVPTEVNDADIKLYGYGFEGIFHLMPEGRFLPFLAIGIGGIHYSTPFDISEMNKFAVDYGAGLKFFLTDDIALRADVRHVLPLNDRYNDLLVTFGINFAFGGQKQVVAAARVEEPAATVAPVEVVMDSDKDGVPDYLDKCPNTPAGVAVDKDGCPLDSDKDGVPDYLDKCPGTPVGMVVDETGCPVDSDKDGVPDYLDKCLNTPAGVAVDKDGCSAKQRQEAQFRAVDHESVPDKVFIALNLKFDTGKAVVKKKYYKVVKKVAVFMKAHPETKVVIKGYTDNVGKKAFNSRLSKARAESVRKCLIDKFGIKASRITAVGYGKNKPMASNNTKKGRYKNRRIEASIEAVQKNSSVKVSDF